MEISPFYQEQSPIQGSSRQKLDRNTMLPYRGSENQEGHEYPTQGGPPYTELIRQQLERMQMLHQQQPYQPYPPQSTGVAAGVPYHNAPSIPHGQAQDQPPLPVPPLMYSTPPEETRIEQKAPEPLMPVIELRHKRRVTEPSPPALPSLQIVAAEASQEEVDSIIDARKRRRSDETQYHFMTSPNMNVGALHALFEEQLDTGESLMLTSDITVDIFMELKLLHEMLTDELCKLGFCQEAYGISMLMERLQQAIDNKHLFPTEVGQVPAPDFMDKIRGIYTGFCRVYLHLYQYHYLHYKELSATEHLNTCCRRLCTFIQHNKIMEPHELAKFQHRVVQYIQ